MPLLNLKVVDWAWDGSKFNARTPHSLLQSLLQHKPPLQALMSMAPSGFPAHSSMKSGLASCNNDFEIFDCKPGQIDRVTTDSASAWRSMTKCIYNWKRNGGL